MNTMRQRTIIAAAVAVATFGLTGCQDSAPPVAKSTATSTQSSDTSSDTSSSSSSSDTSSSTESSSSSDTSSSSSSSGGGVSQSSQAGACNNTSSYYNVKGGSTQLKKYGEVQNVTSSGDAKVDITASKGEAKDAGDTYPYDEGDMQALVFNIKYKLTSSDGYMVTTRLSFSLIDENGRNCQQDSLPDFLPQKEIVAVESLRAGDKTEYEGKVIFAVPKGKDYSKYTLLWTDDYGKGAEANVGWQG